MSTTISEAFVQQYSQNVAMLAQQKGSRLRDTVRNERHVGKAVFYDRIGRTAAVRRTSRHGDTPRIDVPHSRRRVTLIDYDWADLIDNADRVRLSIDPASHYVTAAGWAMGRAMDDEIVAAALGSAWAGETGQTDVPLPPAQVVAASGSGLTVAKLLSVKELLDGNDVDPDEPRFVACTARQITNLLSQTEVKSSDYNTVKALAQGDVDSFLGFRFIRTQRLPVETDGTRRCVAWTKEGVLLSVGAEPVAKLTERPDKNYATQVYFSMSVGATRMEEERVVEVKCVE